MRRIAKMPLPPSGWGCSTKEITSYGRQPAEPAIAQAPITFIRYPANLEEKTQVKTVDALLLGSGAEHVRSSPYCRLEIEAPLLKYESSDSSAPSRARDWRDRLVLLLLTHVHQPADRS